MKRSDAIRLGAGALTVGAWTELGGVAAAQQKMVLKAFDVHPPGYPTVVAVEDMGK
ncbi:MAG: TRAP transporter substrate-binding protein, partial [Candidatus Eremiobacteraeota bacterium]|nr:TRAP transporter substrate-binding protein [Candidatus Eremiobacteraeota bacterium]